jgi:hypothetical protein
MNLSLTLILKAGNAGQPLSSAPSHRQLCQRRCRERNHVLHSLTQLPATHDCSEPKLDQTLPNMASAVLPHRHGRHHYHHHQRRVALSSGTALLKYCFSRRPRASSDDDLNLEGEGEGGGGRIVYGRRCRVEAEAARADRWEAAEREVRV